MSEPRLPDRGDSSPGVTARIAALLSSWAGAWAELGRVLRATVSGAVHGRREPGAAFQQMFEVGNRSLFFVLVTLGFVGMVSVFQVCLQLERVLGDLSKVGLEFIKLMVHESGPSITALMLATRVGAGIAAEIGSMVVTEQVDALRMSGVDPIDYLLVPRFIATTLMTPVLVLFALASSIAAGTAMAYFAFGVNPRLFADFSAVALGDGVVGITKSVAFGAAIPVVSGYCGLTTHGGSEGVGAATTRAVILSSLAVLVLDFVLSMLGFIVFAGPGA